MRVGLGAPSNWHIGCQIQQVPNPHGYIFFCICLLACMLTCLAVGISNIELNNSAIELITSTLNAPLARGQSVLSASSTCLGR